MRRSKLNLQNLLIYFSYGIILICFGGVLIAVLSLSLKTPAQIFSYPPKLIPNPVAWANYLKVFQQSKMPIFLYNSIKIVFFTTLGVLLVSIPAAYGFSRFDFKQKRVASFGILAFQMLSPLIVIIPLYRYFNQLNLINSHFATILTLIAIQIPFTTWLLKGFFDSIPRGIDDYARIDGCSRFQTLIWIILPLSAPGIAAAVIFNSLQSWGNFIIPFVLLEDTNLYPVSVGIYQFQTIQEEITTHLLAAGSIISIAPVVLIFIFLQRYIVNLLIQGSVKG